MNFDKIARTVKSKEITKTHHHHMRDQLDFVCSIEKKNTLCIMILNQGENI